MIKIFSERDGHEDYRQGTGGSSCFYDTPSDVTNFLRSLLEGGERVEIRTARIEVTEEDGQYHSHDGYTFGVVLSGSGFIKSTFGALPIGPGDRFCFGPGEPHLSIALPGRNLIEIIVYVGKAGDQQELLELP